jgi:hypothetical protein
MKMLSEAFEASSSPEEALVRFKEQVQKYRRGEETMAVVDMYEMAALNHGVTFDQIQEAWIHTSALEEIDG